MSTVCSPVETRSFEFIARYVFQKSAIVLEANKYYLIESRLMPVAREHGLSSISDVALELQNGSNRKLSQQVIDAMTTNETSFFRDVLPFDAFKNQIIPELIQKRKHLKTLNIWSCACSSGQEIYSLAMILRENFPVLADWKVRLIASDLCTSVLKRAQDGIFNQTEVNRGLPMTMLLKYFKQSGMQWQIKEDIRSSVDFKIVNLIESWPYLPQMDVIFLRNVLIYFSPETKTSILNKMQQTMSPDGYLFLGGAETTLNLNTSLNRIPVGKTYAYRPGS